MLWFVGLGVSGPDSIPKEVGKIIQKADLVYLESFTQITRDRPSETLGNLSRT